MTAGFAKAVAQDVYYDIWIDDNLRLRQHEAYTGDGQSLALDVSNMSPGLHFLNVIPYSSTGEQSAWKRIAFLMPEQWPGTTEGAYVEYWIDDSRQLRQHKAYAAGEQSFAMDISDMSAGLHFLNYRVFNSRGEAGAWKRIAFYISNNAFEKEDVGYEYWMDEGEHQTGLGAMPGMLPIQIDMEGLSVGKHTFYFRACNAAGKYGETYEVTFTLALQGDVNGNGQIDIGDAVSIVNDLVGKPNDTFVEKAADTNGNSQTDIGDAVTIVNSLVGKTAPLGIVVTEE